MALTRDQLLRLLCIQHLRSTQLLLLGQSAISFNGLPTLRPLIAGQRITERWLLTLPDEISRHLFRFSASEIINLVTVLQLPPVIRTYARCLVTAVEGFCLLLARLRSSGELSDLSMKYQRSRAAISQITYEVADLIHERWQHKLHFDTTFLSSNAFSRYAAAVFDAGSPVQTIWGFIDCTFRRTCRPMYSQRLCYSGHKKCHGLKYQAVCTPDGMIAHLFGPVEGRRNDNYLLTQSKLLGNCATHAVQPDSTPSSPAYQRFYQIFGDKAYSLGPHLLALSSRRAGTMDQAMNQWNISMSILRISIEHTFADVSRLWPFLDVWWRMRIFQGPVGLWYRVAVILTNAHNCYRPNQTSQFFDCDPPSVEEYFS